VNGNNDGGKDKEKKSTCVNQKIKGKKKNMDGRNVLAALKCKPRKSMVFKGDCSASPFKKEDNWTQNLGDKESRLQLWNKIVDNENLKRYILCFAFSSVVQTCTDNDLFPFPTTMLVS
jgi:hypothetical protein